MTPEQAPGAPGIAPRWTSSAKDGIGTAYHTSSRVWFTLSHGILNEIYYPHVDSPNTRDLQFLLTDGETFFHEEKRDLLHHCERPDPDAMFYRLTNSDPDGRYRVIKEIICEPHSSVVLQSVKVEIVDESLKDKLQLFVLLAPHIKNTGGNNTALLCEFAGQHFLRAEREDVHLVLGCDTDFIRRSVGFVGVSDGWRDIKDNLQMNWQFTEASNGNVAMTAQVDLSRRLEFVIGVSLGGSHQSAATALLQAFAGSFADQRAKFIAQWKRTQQRKLSEDTETNSLVRLSQHVLMAHEDKQFSGATVASMSIPWGETKDDSDAGGYHLVWARDMVQTTTALLACGEKESPLRALVWLASIQGKDGGMPQNSSIDGTSYWHGVQLDEVAAPVILAWRLKAADALCEFDPTTLIRRAVHYLILNGPVTGQERWEENSGYSPSTLATIISAIVCAAEFANAAGETKEARFLLEHADWMVASLEKWTVTNCGELLDGKPRHFIRLTPQASHPGPADPNPDSTMIQIGNGGGEHPARNIVDAGFLQLVRMGIIAWDHPLVIDSLAVVDAVLKRELPQGPCWRRYNFDGYGQHPDGSAFDGTGEGRVWPLLTGERGHYEVAAGRDVTPYIKAMEGFASDGGLLAEQLWDADDIPGKCMFFGKPAGSAMPLCWAHAEYISLVRSQKDGICFDRVETVYQRYANGDPSSHIEVWTFAHQLTKIPSGKLLRIVCDLAAVIRWSSDNWSTEEFSPLQANGLGLFYVDLPTDSLSAQSEVSFTFHRQSEEHREETTYIVEIT